MATRLCVGQWTEVLDGQAFFEAPHERTLLYTRRRFMPVGGRGYVEVYAPKDYERQCFRFHGVDFDLRATIPSV